MLQSRLYCALVLLRQSLHCAARLLGGRLPAWPEMAIKSGALLCLSCAPVLEAAGRPGPIQLQNVTPKTGVHFVHQDGSSGRRYIVESVASGLALLDYNGDGRIDIYFLNGRPLPGSTAPPSRNALYRNDGNWRFTDVTEEAGVPGTGYALAVCVGDYDNDGHPDIYVSNFGRNVLYRNMGNGKFADVTDRAGVGNGTKVGAGACFLDYNADGYLDLFVANYIDFSFDKHQTRFVNGYPAYVGPMMYGPVPATLFRNNQDGTFTDVSRETGIASQPGTGMGVVCADYNEDGHTDIIVGNDAMANFVWRNDGKGHFEEVGLITGLAYDRNGIGLGTMGVDCADYDNDGRLDFFMTSYMKQWAVLYRNVSGNFFDDVTHLTGAGTGTFNQVTWGTGLVDFDNDGDRDLFIACGHLQDNVELWDDTSAYEAPNILLENVGQGKFIDASRGAGDGLAVKASSRGAAFDDLDNDGRVDAVVLNARREPTILRNVSSNSNHWVGVRLRGTRTNRDGIGARIKVVAGELVQVDEVHSGRSYQSHYGMYPHFGLGPRKKIDRIEVRWIGGGTNVVENVDGDRVITITEDMPPFSGGGAGAPSRAVRP